MRLRPSAPARAHSHALPPHLRQKHHLTSPLCAPSLPPTECKVVEGETTAMHLIIKSVTAKPESACPCTRPLNSRMERPCQH